MEGDQFGVVEVQRGSVEDLAEVDAQYLVLGDASPTPPTNVVLTVVSDAKPGVLWPPLPRAERRAASAALLGGVGRRVHVERPRALRPFHETVVFSAVVDAATDLLQYLIPGLDPGVT
jgi:hypothetical protein